MRRRLLALLLAIAAGGAGAARGQCPATVSIQGGSVQEGDIGDTVATFNILFNDSDVSPLNVDFTTRDGSATVADGDYDAKTGNFQLEGGIPQMIDVTVHGDTKVEIDEDFSIELTCDGVGPPLIGQGSILNDDVTELVIDDVAVAEGDAGTIDAVFTVSLSNPSDFAVAVDFATADGSATTMGGDYQATSGTLNISPGQTSGTISVTVNGDLTQETDETFRVDLMQASNATISDPVGQGTILNDDQATLSIDDVSVTEGDAGTTAAVFTVTLSLVSDFLVTVSFATADGAATAADNDYQPTSGMLSFTPGVTSQTVTVLVNGDLKVEADETYNVNLSAPNGAAILDGSGLGTILNDDGASLSIGDAEVVEGDSATVDAFFDVTLSAPSDTTVIVDVATRDGSATVADGDYQPAAATLTFPPGATVQSFRVAVNGDTRVEPDESFKAVLGNPDGARIGRRFGVAAIRNDDDATAAGVIRLVPPPAIGEAAGTATVTAERTGGTSGPASVDFETVDGTATAGQDYGATAGTLSWADGESGPKSFIVSILDDNLSEPDETVGIVLGNPQGAALGASASGELTIIDDDQATTLEPRGEPNRDGKVEALLTLEALATRADGTPVAGATVVWTVEGDGELVGDATTTTGADGVASQQVRLGSSPGTVRVIAEIPDTGQRVVFEIVVEGDLDELFDPLTNPAENAVAQALNAACEVGGGEFGELCDYLFGLDPEDQRRVISELTPREAGALADLLLQTPQVQLLNLRQHLAARRNGGGAGNQIALDFGGQTLPLGTFRVAIAGYREAERRLAARIDAAMLQQGEAPAAAAEPVEIDSESRLGFFASGRVEAGDRPGSAREEGFDLDTTGLTVGVDYRLRPRFILGGALGLADTETTLVANGGGIDVRGESLSLFFTWFTDKSWLDGIVSWSRNEYETARNIDLPVPFAGQSRLVARSRPDGTQLAVELGAGYDATLGATVVGTFGRLSWFDGDVDPYTEEGAGPFNLSVAGQSIESLLLEAGLELVYASSQRWGVLQPLVRASVLHEFEDDSRAVVAGFAADPGGNLFAIATDPPDRDYLRLAAGLTATFPRGRAVYLLYETDLERDDLDLYRLSGGLRLQF